MSLLAKELDKLISGQLVTENFPLINLEVTP